MEIKKIPINKLNTATYNPRKDLKPGDAEYEKLKNSIHTYGYVDPVIWNQRTGNVVGGHQRLKILIEDGVQEVECSVVDLDDANEKALNLALNKISGDWDDERLTTLLNELDHAGFDIALTGFDNEEVEELIKTYLGQEASEDDFDVEQALKEIAEPTTQPGDVWKLGDHLLLCGDVLTDTPQVFRDGEEADLLMTDPPYNVAYEGKTAECLTLENDNQTEAEFAEFLDRSCAAASAILKTGGAFYIWHSDVKGEWFRRACRLNDLMIKECLIWKKNEFILGRQDYHWQHEPCLYGWKAGGSHYFTNNRCLGTIISDPELEIDKMDKATMRQMLQNIFDSVQTTVLEYNKPLANREHPTMKPVGLFSQLINNSSRRGEIVFDPFAGSGTTMVACEQLGRKARLIEIDPKYCDVIVQRYIELTGSKEVYRNGMKAEI